MRTRNRVLRRDLLVVSFLAIATMILAACGAGAPVTTQTGATSAPAVTTAIMAATTEAAVEATQVASSTVATSAATQAPQPATTVAATSAATPPLVSSAGKLVIWSPGDNGTVKDWNQDPILKAVEDATGVQIEMVKVPSDHYTDQVNAAIASGKVPDIIGCIDYNNHQLTSQLVHDGVVTAFDGELAGKLQNVLAEYKKMPGTDELKIDGHIYMKPINWETRPWWGSVIHLRKDLLDKYGMQPPDTFDQYFAFLRRAKQDGSTGVIFGAGGTGGLGGAIDSFVAAYGVPPGGWVKKNGTWEYWAIQPGTKSGLLLFRKMVAEGLVDPVSWELKESPRDKYVAGEGASMIWNGGGHTGRIQNDMTLAGKGAKEWTPPALDAGAGARGYAGAPPFYCASFISNMKGNRPADAAKVLDYLASSAGLKLTAIGLEGRDYQGSGDAIKLLPKRAEDGFGTEAGDTGAHPLATELVSWVPQSWQDFALLYGKDVSFKAWYIEMLANQGKYLVPTTGTLSTSPAWTDFQSTGNDLQTRAFLEIVKAKDEATAGARFDQFVKEWKSGGGDQAAGEMNDVLNKIYK